MRRQVGRIDRARRFAREDQGPGSREVPAEAPEHAHLIGGPGATAAENDCHVAAWRVRDARFWAHGRGIYQHLQYPYIASGEQLCSYSACVHVSCTFDRLNRCWEGRRTLPYGGARIAKGASMSTDAAKAVVRRNTEEVQSRGNFDVFEELFAVDFVDHTPQPNSTPHRDGARSLYRRLRAAFPDFHADIHWQAADGELVTTYKTYHGTHQGTFLGV